MIPFITFSKLRAKFLNKNYNYYTLSKFIYKLFERNFNQKIIDKIESKYIILNVINSLELSHFGYINENSNVLDDLVTFIIQVKRNEVNIKDLGFDEKKSNELIQILKKYNEFLDKKKLADLGDIEKNVLEYVKNNKIKVEADKFEIFNTHFFTSKLQKKIYDNLDKEIVEYKLNKKLKNQYLLRSFNEYDEVKNALKLVNSLLDINELSDIKIVVSDIDRYYPIFEVLFEEYNLRGYSTKGKRVIDLAKNLQKQYKDNLNFEATNIKKRLEKIGIDVDKNIILKELLQNKRILFKDGLEITETNQVFLYDNVKHLIFVGVDLGSFPPKREKNIFYTDEFENHFFMNNLYQSSKDIYEYIKHISENLYITYPSYKGKSKNSISLIIDKELKELNIDKKADIELIKENKRIKVESIEEFLNDLKNDNLDEYNGKVSSSNITKLSVSKLNSYIKCPRKFFYTYVLNLAPAVDESKELEATTQGKMMHKAFELIVKENNEFNNIDVNSYAKRAYDEILQEEELDENIFTKLYFEKLKELIEKFIIYLNEENITNSKTEVEFYLDDNLKISDENDYFIKGFIDRLDENEEIKIVDYKSSKKDSVDKNKVLEIVDLKDLQLGLYTYYAKQKYNKEVRASLLTFNTKKEYTEFATLKMCDEVKYSRGKPEFACYNETYEKDMIEKIYKIKNKILNGEFFYNDEDEKICEWCDYRLICKRYENE